MWFRIRRGLSSKNFVPKNALSPMEETLSGIVTLSRLEQPENALLPMEVTPVGIATLLRLEQP